jgi:hypothetical protein
VGAVAGVQRHGEDLRRAGRQRPCGLGETARADVAHDRPAGDLAEGADHVVARQARHLGDVVEADVLQQVALDEPDRSLDGIHAGSYETPVLCPAASGRA